MISEIITILQPNLLLVNAEANNTSAIALPSGGTAPYIYSWSNGDTTQTIVNLLSGVYTITVEDSNGCKAIESVITDIQFSIDSLTNISSNSLGAIYISSNTNSAQYEWSGPNGYSSIDEDIVDLTDAGCYTVIVTDVSQFSSDTTICISDITTVENYNIDLQEIDLFPNPSSDKLKIRFKSPVTSVEIKIINVSGQTQDIKVEKALESNLFQIDISNLENGVHFIRLIVGDYVSTKKILVRHK